LGVSITCFFLGTNEQCQEVIEDYNEDCTQIVLKALDMVLFFLENIMLNLQIQFKPSLLSFLQYDVPPVSKSSAAVTKSDGPSRKKKRFSIGIVPAVTPSLQQQLEDPLKCM